MWHDLTRRLAKGAIRLANWLVDGLVLSFVVLIVCYSAYVLIDNGHVADAASAEVFESYKPDAEGPGFDELRAQNPDVCGWLTLYGTGVDYPVVQGADNDEYLNTDPTGNFALSGSLFIDYRCQPNIAGASTIIFGHHMENSLMFGDLDKYAQATYLEQHKYGDLYYDGAHHGVEVVAYVAADAYDSTIYSTTVGESPSTEDFISYVRDHAAVWNGELSPEDHMLVLSTCAAGTNERHVVFAKITSQTYDNPYQEETVSRALEGTANEGFPLWAKVGLAVLVFVLVAWVVGAPRKPRVGGGAGANGKK